MNVLVFAGGLSPEYEVSIRSGLAISSALINSGHRVLLSDPLYSRGGKAVEFYSDFEKAKSEFIFQRQNEKAGVFHTDNIDAIKLCDKVFPALHGGIGENGRLAAMLEVFGASYSGSVPEALAVSMDKIKTKVFYEYCGIPTPLYTVYKRNSARKPLPPSYPCVVKPADGGSSIGVSFVTRESELSDAINKALEVCDTVLLEQRIFGREFSVCVLEDKALSVTEIIPQNDYYDYECKYIHGKSREITPAPLPKDLTSKALNIAVRAHLALGLKNFSRTDLILKRESGIFYALETNALPGLTETSILPSAAQVCGISFSELACKML